MAHILDSAPLRFDRARLKESVLLEPGAPTMIRGVLVQQQAMMLKRFSIRAFVFAMPRGMLKCLA